MIRRWGTLDLLDVLKDAEFLTEFSTEFTSVASREVIDRETLRRRLLLCLFALGTNMGMKAIVATGEHGETEAALRHVRRHFITHAGLAAARARGRRGGRKPKMTPELVDKAQRMYDSRQFTMAEIATSCGGVTPMTIYRNIRIRTVDGTAADVA